MEYGTLYIVATPIGNLEDITYRAIRILNEVDIIAAEDTRHTLKLLNHYEITKHLISYHRHNEETKSEELILKLKTGKNIALVSDAGTPGICDPGNEVINKCLEEGIKVIPIPGACAFVNALICSGLNTDSLILYEAPHKLSTTLNDLKEFVSNRKIVIARELTKIHEQFITGTIEEIIEKTKEIKGEIIILIEKAVNKKAENNFLEHSLEDHFKYYEEQGLEKKEIIKKMAKDRGVSKNEIYMYFNNKR